MGLLDGVLAQVIGQVGGNNQTMKMVQAVIGMVGGGGSAGGVQGLMEKFQAGGLGDAAESWIGTGENHEVSAGQMRSALGDAEVQRVADEAGVSKDDAATGMAALLPSIIDEVTPDGRVPDASALADRLGKLL